MRRLALGLMLLPLIAACGGGGGATKTTRLATPDPGKAALATLLKAAGDDDRRALWDVLSKPSQQRLGPSFETFKVRSAPVIEQALRSFENGPPTPFISQNISQQFGIVAVRSGTKALAFPLRHERDGWKIETPGPLQFQILGPQPGSAGSVAQIGVEVRSPGVVADAVVWVDGKLVRPTLAPSQRTATVFANLAHPLQPGVHIAVVYAEEGANAGAEAWTFTATKP